MCRAMVAGFFDNFSSMEAESDDCVENEITEVVGQYEVKPEAPDPEAIVCDGCVTAHGRAASRGTELTRGRVVLSAGRCRRSLRRSGRT